MPIITIFHGSFCHEQEVVGALQSHMGLPVLTDNDLLEAGASRLGIQAGAMRKTLFHAEGPKKFLALEKKRNLAMIKAMLSDSLSEDMICVGSFTHLIPRDITHVLHVLLIAECGYRVEQVVKHGFQPEAAQERVIMDDKVAKAWTGEVLQKEPWDHGLYDVVIPMDKKSIDEAVASVLAQASKDILQPTPDSRRAVEDFQLATSVELALANEGHTVPVEANRGVVILTIVQKVIMLAKVEDELRRIASSVPGVREVHVRLGPDFYQKSIYRKHEPDKRGKLLLVDDEREFVHTLSERLMMREIGSAVVYDGEQALAFVDEDEPDVMVLDLKMPGIDGIEVLRRVHARHPDVRVIILTGHGSKEDEQQCLELGAFAYLQKPVDIDVLTHLLQQARAEPE